MVYLFPRRLNLGAETFHTLMKNLQIRAASRTLHTNLTDSGVDHVEGMLQLFCRCHTVDLTMRQTAVHPGLQVTFACKHHVAGGTWWAMDW